MASTKVLEEKKQIIETIKNSIKDSESVILFEYQGLTVSNMKELRAKLKDADAYIKVYKNTLLKRALEDLKIDFEGFLEGPNAILFGKNLLEPIKVLSDYAKDNEKLKIRIGIISGEVADLAKIKEYASIPSMEGLLTQLAGGMIEHVRNLSIAINLYAEGKEGDVPQKEEVKETTEEVKEENTSVEEAPVEEATDEVPVEESVEEVKENETEEVQEESNEVTENAEEKEGEDK